MTIQYCLAPLWFGAANKTVSLQYDFSSFSRRRSEHTDRNVELKPTVLFRTTPTHLEIAVHSQPPTVLSFNITHRAD